MCNVTRRPAQTQSYVQSCLIVSSQSDNVHFDAVVPFPNYNTQVF